MASHQMRTLEEIEGAIRQLSHEDLVAFRTWFAEYDAELWDQQIERDVRDGRLDQLADEAIDDLVHGRCTGLSGDVD